MKIKTERKTIDSITPRKHYEAFKVVGGFEELCWIRNDKGKDILVDILGEDWRRVND